MLKRDSDLKYVINHRRACAARVTVLGQSVFLSDSRTTGYQAAYEQYQRLHRNTGSKNNVADFAETSAYEQYQWLHRNTGSKNSVADFAEMSNKFESEKLALSWCV